MKIFKEEIERLYEALERTQLAIDQTEEKNLKINKLLPEERIAIYIYEKLHGVTVQGEFFGTVGCVWLNDILEFANKRAIRELKGKSIWEEDVYKTYMAVAKKLLNEIGFEKSEKTVDIIFTAVRSML